MTPFCEDLSECGQVRILLEIVLHTVAVDFE